MTPLDRGWPRGDTCQLMAFFKRESLELLRQRVDLAEVVEAHVELKRAGAAYKGLCRSSKLIQT